MTLANCRGNGFSSAASLGEVARAGHPPLTGPPDLPGEQRVDRMLSLRGSPIPRLSERDAYVGISLREMRFVLSLQVSLPPALPREAQFWSAAPFSEFTVASRRPRIWCVD